MEFSPKNNIFQIFSIFDLHLFDFSWDLVILPHCSPSITASGVPGQSRLVLFHSIFSPFLLFYFYFPYFLFLFFFYFLFSFMFYYFVHFFFFSVLFYSCCIFFLFSLFNPFLYLLCFFFSLLILFSENEDDKWHSLL